MIMKSKIYAPKSKPFIIMLLGTLLLLGLPVQQLFADESDIMITEIMYNPPEDNTDSLEFIELYNNGDTDVELTGFYFSAGIGYTFPDFTLAAGTYVVVAFDSVAIWNSFAVEAFQWNSSGLNNSGELIELKNPSGQIIDQVYYDDSYPWPSAADGEGPSLEFCDYELDNSLGANWSAATHYQIKNASGDSIWCTPGEYCNPWYEAPISDFEASQTDILPGWSIDFTDLTQGNPDSWSWTFSGGQPATSTEQNPQGIMYANPGTYEVCLTTTNGYGSDTECKTAYITVSSPPNAEIIITEIMYNSPDADIDSLEFIELYNTGPDHVNLESWSISEAVNFTFGNVVLNAGQRLIVAKDPEAIQNTFGIPSYDWNGSLNNTAATILLKDNYGIVRDSVRYSDAAPWPARCDGDGPSLTLCNPSLDNALASSWSASTEVRAFLNNGDTVYATPLTGCLYPPDADFAAGQTDIYTGTTVQFTDLSTNSPTSWEWTFEGGSPATSTQQNPQVTYENTGHFMVMLKVSNADGSDSLMRENYMHVASAPSGANLVITEIMYNPPDANTDSLEFIEVLNAGTTVVNLQGFYFDEGINFTFPDYDLQAGSRILVSRYADIFQDFYGVASLQWESGVLNSDGELILLKDAAGVTLDSVVYSPFAPWPERCAGHGPSLTLCDPSLDNALAESWSASEEFVGLLSDGDSVYASPGTGCIYYPQADFAADTNRIFENGAIQFTDRSGNVPDAWYWEFEGGSPASSTEENPLITYAEAGVYSVKLKVSNIYGVDSVLREGYISVLRDPAVYKITITEIMYNSPDADTDSLDFIEIYNNGDKAVNLEGFYFDEGIDYTFPDYDFQPGDYYLICKDDTAFRNFFGVEAQEWEGNLVNSGEDIILMDNFGSMMDSLVYADTLPWPPECGGNGPSLTLCNPDEDNALAASWRPSEEFQGTLANEKSVYASPGTACKFAPKVDFSANATNIEEGGSVQFTDLTENNPTEWYWEFPGGSPEASSEQNPEVIYDQAGIYNVRLTATNEFGTASTEKEGYILVSFEPGSNDLVITEIMYNSPDAEVDSLDFIEIFNNGDEIVKLMDFYFRDGVDFTFPDWDLYPGSYLVIAKDAEAMQEFFGTNCLQWTSGSLNNTGESIVLVDKLGNILDSVQYSNQLPWPTKCDGGGPSLTLCDPLLDNTLAESWSASEDFRGLLTNGDSVWATPGSGCIRYPIARFSADIQIIQEGNEVQFTDASRNNPESWEWNFPGGTPEYSEEQNPLIQYNEGGIYDVQLIVANEHGSDTLRKKRYISVSSSPTNAELVITEIMYNSPDEIYDSIEFFEIYNNGTEPVDMSQIIIVHGVVYDFPEIELKPKRYFVLAKDSMAMKNTFDLDVYQWSEGSLRNGGELILLRDRAGVTIDSVWYSDTLPWPMQCNGEGPSLTLCNPNNDNTLASSWAPSRNIAAVLTNGDVVYATPGQGCFGTPTADFEADNPEVYEEESVQFHDLSTGIPSEWFWTFEGGTPSTSTDKNPIVKYKQKGSWAVTLTVSNSIGSDTETKNSYIEVLEGSSINEKDTKGLKIYPNPAHESLFIENELYSAHWLAMTDITGRTIKTLAIKQGKTLLNISGFDAGFYLLRFYDQSNALIYTTKLQIH